MRHLSISLLFALLICQSLSAQKPEKDSLLGLWQAENVDDSLKMLAYNDLIFYYYLFYDPDTAIEMSAELYQYAQDRSFPYFQAKAYNVMGYAWIVGGEPDSAVHYTKESFKIRSEIGDTNGMAGSQNNLGLIYKYIRKDSLALEHYQTSLDLYKITRDTTSLINTRVNMANIYTVRGNYAMALDLYNNSLKLATSSGIKTAMAMIYGNIAAIYGDNNREDEAIMNYRRSSQLLRELGDERSYNVVLNNLATSFHALEALDSAIFYYEKSLALSRELGVERQEARVLANYGRLLLQLGDLEPAEKMLLKSLEIKKALKDPTDLPTSYHELADLYLAKNQNKRAFKYAYKGFEAAKFKGSPKDIGLLAEWLYKYHKSAGNYQQALNFYEISEEVSDSLYNIQNKEAVIQQEFRHEYEQKALEDSLKNAQEKVMSEMTIAKQKAEIKAKRSQQYLLFGGIGMIGIFAAFIFNRFRISQRQKTIIESQKQEVENAHAILSVKNEEIMDSIQYAKRIQGAILPPDKVVDQYLKEAFILYKPKDVVAGDFYWLTHQADTIFFAAADCTGHGVPGAMVSVVCNNALNRSVKEFGIQEPGKILDQTKELVVSEFERSDEEVNDGMDIALCSIKEKELSFAGANNPLWIVPAGEFDSEQLPKSAKVYSPKESDRQLIEIRADKQPIGQFENDKPFTTHQIKLNQGDTIYLFSDGYVDQFGGEKGKKFKSLNFRRLLLSLQELDMQAQKEQIDRVFEEWRGTEEQIDDVCVIGVRI